MTRAWKSIDLQGDGLQSVNLRLVKRLKKPALAYLLWMLFPAGAHCIYLGSPYRSLIYSSLSAVTVVLLLATGHLASLVPFLGACAFALYDLHWIRQRIPDVNKKIRMEAYLSEAPAAPPGYRGRFTDDDPPQDQVREGGIGWPRHQTPLMSAPKPWGRVPSFAEQEAMLRELTRKRAE